MGCVLKNALLEIVMFESFLFEFLSKKVFAVAGTTDSIIRARFK